MKPTNNEELQKHVQVRNIGSSSPSDNNLNFYIGRYERSDMVVAHLGNPYEIGKDGDRDEVCDKHRLFLKGRLKDKKSGLLQDHVHALSLVSSAIMNEPDKPVRLWCYCAPRRCHGDFIRKILIERLHQAWNIQKP